MEGRCQHGGHGTKIQKYNLSNQHQEIRPSKSNSNFKKVWKTFYLGRFFFRHFKSVLTDSCPQTDEPLMFDIGCVFQALQAALPPDCLDAQHVRGHAGDPWNEMADFLAKS